MVDKHLIGKTITMKHDFQTLKQKREYFVIDKFDDDSLVVEDDEGNWWNVQYSDIEEQKGRKS
jgi:maltodextrin utilization protein YvdJ